MKAGFILSLTVGTAVVCGLWVGFCAAIAYPLIVSWAGFAGCTSYFSSGGGPKNLIRSLISNACGVAVACAIIFCGQAVPFGETLWFSMISVGFFSGVMVYLMHCDFTKMANLTFFGCFSTFASGGNWKMVLLSMFLGNFVGVAWDYCGKTIYKLIFEQKSKEEDWVILKILKD